MTISHVHSGALGWVGFVSFGAIYCLVPWLWERKQLVVAIGGIVEITPLFYLKRWGGSLGAFLWALKTGQYEDFEGAA